MSARCGHTCCGLDGGPHENRYGVECPFCLAAAGGPAGVGGVDLGQLVASVLARVAPEIPGLPTGTALAERVVATARAVCARAAEDGDPADLAARARHRVLVGRVGPVLAELGPKEVAGWIR